MFDLYGVGVTQPWFSDDQASWGPRNRALIKGTDGLDGQERQFLVDVLARPYPQTTAGIPRFFGFDWHSLTFTMKVTPNPYIGESEIFVPRERYYPEDFRIDYNSAIILEYDANSSTGLSVVENPGDMDASTISWNEMNSTIVIQRWSTAIGDHTVQIYPIP